MPSLLPPLRLVTNKPIPDRLDGKIFLSYPEVVKKTAQQKTEDSRNGILRSFICWFVAVDNFLPENEYNNHNPMEFCVSWG